MSSFEEFVSTEIDTEAMLNDYMNGVSSEVPVDIARQTNNVSAKLNLGSALILVENMKRAQNMVRFLEAAESVLYDPSGVLSMEPAELMDTYKECTKTLNATLEFIRKYKSQNKEDLSISNEKVDTVRDLLSTLPKDKLDNLIDKLTRGDL